ncbi:MAG: hypothetical protein K1W24_07770 [Lachnospiraceae bacterium]
MGHNIHIRKILITAKSEYLKWICNERMVLLLVAFVFINNIIITPLLEHSKVMESPINILEPYIAVLNSNTMIITVPVIFLALFSDFPMMKGNTLFILIRTSKLDWLLGQLLFVFYAVASYIGILFGFSVLTVLNEGFWANGWSLVVTKYAELYPDQAYSMGCLLIKWNLHHQVSPWYAAAAGTVMMFLYLMLVPLIMLFFYTFFHNKVTGLLTVGIITALGSVFYIADMEAMWFFPIAHIAIQAHFTKYFAAGNIPAVFSFVYFVLLFLMLFIGSVFGIKRADFESIPEID